MKQRLVVRIGLSCNNHCKFCIFDDKNRDYQDRSEVEIRKILSSNRGYEGLVLTGGEPCLRPDLCSLIRYAKLLGFKEIQVQSNGRMFIYRDLCKELIDAGASEFAVALHGHNAKIHDFLTSCEGSFEQTVGGIKILKELGQDVITNTVITKTNYRHLSKIAAFLADLKINHFQFSFIHIIGRAWENRGWIVPHKSKVIPFLKKGLGVGLRSGRRVTTEAIPYCLLQNYEDCIVESVIPKSKVFEMDFTIADLKRHRIYRKKSKRRDCRACGYYRDCEGPWKEYPKIFGWGEFKPCETSRLGK